MAKNDIPKSVKCSFCGKTQLVWAKRLVWDDGYNEVYAPFLGSWQRKKP